MREIELDGYPFKRYRYADSNWGWKDSPSYRPLKLHLMKVYKVCYFCKIEVKDYPHVEGTPMHQPDLATIEHIKPRPVAGRGGRRRHEAVDKVLCCYKCNHDRNVAYQKGELYV